MGDGLFLWFPDAVCKGDFFSGLVCFFKDFIYLLLERGEGREKEWDRNINV